MSMTWNEVLTHPDMQGLKPDQLEAARNQYFTDVVVPLIPGEQIDAARIAFDADTALPESSVFDTVKELGQSIYEGLAVHTPGSIAAAFQGSDISDEGLSGFLIERSRLLTEQRAAEPGGDKPSAIPGIKIHDLRELGSTVGFSVTAMGAGLVAGIPASIVGSFATPITGTVAGYSAGMSAAGTAGYRMDVNMVTRELKDAADEESMELYNKPLSDQEWQTKLTSLQDEIHKHGLFEAVPEAVGSGAGFAVLTTAAKVFGKGVLARFATKLASLYGEEILTETVTQIGQQGVEARTGLRAGEEERSFSNIDDWLTSAKEVAPQVFLLSTIMGGGVKGGQILYDAATRERARQQADQNAIEDITSAPDIDTAIKRATDVMAETSVPLAASEDVLEDTTSIPDVVEDETGALRFVEPEVAPRIPPQPNVTPAAHPVDIAPITPQERAEADKAAERSNTARQSYAKRAKLDTNKDDILAAIAKKGGISREEAEAHGIDPAEFSRRGWGIKRVFTTTGNGLDGMAEVLAQDGYPVTNEQGDYEGNILLDALDRALRGEKVYSLTGGVDAQAALDVEVEMDSLEQMEQLRKQDADLYPAGELAENEYEDLETPEDQHLMDLTEYAKNLGLAEDVIDTILKRGYIQNLPHGDIKRQLTEASQRISVPGADVAPEEPGQRPQASTPAQASQEVTTTEKEDPYQRLRDRESKFGWEKIKQEAENSLAGLILGKGFGEKADDFLARNPDIKNKYDAAKQFLSEGKSKSTDLFGKVPVAQQTLADKQAEIDKKLGKGQEHIPAESVGDLLDPGREKQTDLEDIKTEDSIGGRLIKRNQEKQQKIWDKIDAIQLLFDKKIRSTDKTDELNKQADELHEQLTEALHEEGRLKDKYGNPLIGDILDPGREKQTDIEDKAKGRFFVKFIGTRNGRWVEAENARTARQIFANQEGLENLGRITTSKKGPKEDTYPLKEAKKPETKPTAPAKEKAAKKPRRGITNQQISYAPAPAEAAKVEAAIEGKTAIEAAEFVINSAPNKAHRLIAEKVLAKLKSLESAGTEFTLNVAHKDQQVPNYVVNAQGASFVDFDSNKTHIWLQGADMGTKSGMSYVTVLHELIHAATQSTIYLGNQAPQKDTSLGKSVKDLYSVANTIIAHANQRFADYKAGKVELSDFEHNLHGSRGFNNALQDPNEVIAWGLTHKDFQNYLEGIPYKNRSMWTEFVTAVRKLLGMAPSQDTALSEVLRVSEKMINAPANQLLRYVKGAGIQLSYNVGPRELVSTKEAAKKLEGEFNIGDEVTVEGSTRKFTVVKRHTGNYWLRPLELSKMEQDSGDTLESRTVKWPGYKVSLSAQKQKPKVVYKNKFHGIVPEITEINPGLIQPLNPRELNAAKAAAKNSGKTLKEWAGSMSFDEPIEVSLFSDGTLQVQDGHHRFYAATILDRAVPVRLQAINAKPEDINNLISDATAARAQFSLDTKKSKVKYSDGIQPAEIDLTDFEDVFKGDDVNKTEGIQLHNAKVEAYEILERGGLIDSQVLIDLKNPGDSLKYHLERVGDKRTWDEILEEHEGDEVADDTPNFPYDIFEVAKLARGVTDDINEAGYILPDGTMLDFSGKRDGGPAGERSDDHRSLGFDIKQKHKQGYSEYMIAFQRAGAVRIDARSGSIDFEVAPTSSQLRKLDELFDYNDSLNVDLVDNGRRTTIQIEGPRNLGLINRFYSGEDIEGTYYSLSDDTKAAYEKRIDELFDDGDARRHGTKALDSSDVLSLFGYTNQPVYAVESKIIDKDENHALTTDHWKKIPEWIENPVAVFDSETRPELGRLVFIAPDLHEDGVPIFIIVEPDVESGSIDIHLLVNAYDVRGGKTPVSRWVETGLLRYLDQKQSPDFRGTSGLQLPRDITHLNRGSKEKIYTERDLVKYRKAREQDDQANHSLNQSLYANSATKFTKAQAEKAISLSLDAVSENAGLELEVIHSNDIPQAVAKDIPLGKLVKGFIHQGKVYLVHNHIENARDANMVFVHEVKGHFGVEAIVDKAAKGGWKTVTAEYQKMKDRKLRSKQFDSILAEVHKRYGENLNPTNEVQEFIAVAAERIKKGESLIGPEKQGALAKFLRLVQQLFRKGMRAMGFKQSLSMKDVNTLLSRSEAYLRGDMAGERQDAGSFAVSPAYSMNKPIKTDTPAFKKWFGKSKVVDEDGEPLVVYHGTKADITEFQSGKSSDRGTSLRNHSSVPGVFAESPKYASKYAGKKQGIVYPAYLTINNPLHIENADTSTTARALFKKIGLTSIPENYDINPTGYGTIWQMVAYDQRMVKALLDAGYDGVTWIEGKNERTWVAFDPTQIKSATGNRGTFDPNDPNILHSFGEQQAVFYSQLLNAIQTKGQPKATVQQWEALFKKNGVKQDELEWLDIKGFFEGKLMVKKADLAEFVSANQVQVREVVKDNSDTTKKKYAAAIHAIERQDNLGFDFAVQAITDVVNEGDEWREVWEVTDEKDAAIIQDYIDAEKTKKAGVTKFQGYQLPGGQNYRERFLTLPEAKGYSWKDGHSEYDDVENPLIRIRTNERVDANGKKTLFLEELQRPQKDQEDKMPPWAKKLAPLQAMKWSIRYAVDNGFDSVSWTTGEQQTDRYDLSIQISEIRAEKKAEGEWYIEARNQELRDGRGRVVIDDVFEESKLDEIVGKDLAEKIIKENGGVYSGLDLKVGGEGLKTFYDSMLPNMINKYVKRWGGRVGETDIITRQRDKAGIEFAAAVFNKKLNEQDVATVHSLPITQAMRDSVLGGQTLFSISNQTLNDRHRSIITQARFSLEDKTFKFSSSNRKYSPAQEAAIKKGGFGQKPPLGKAKDRWNDFRSNLGTKVRQGLVDQYASFKNILKDPQAWMMANLSSSSNGALEMILEAGSPRLKEDVIAINAKEKSLRQVLEPLGTEMDDWLMWIAGNRANRLMSEGRERLFDQEDIDALMSLADGKLENGGSRKGLYHAVRRDFEKLNAAVNQIAVESGLLTAKEAAIWEEQGFYLPFYRMVDDQARGPRVFKDGLVRQTAYKKLKGADIQIGDLLGNAMLNWNHLIGSSLKNNAAVRAIDQAVELGLAREIDRRNKSKDAVYVRKEGKEVWYEIDGGSDGALVLDSLLSLNYEGLNSRSMKVARSFKRALTMGVTASPEFKAANLTRDTIQAIAVADMSTNIAKNLYQGWKGTSKGNDAIIQMIAGGGAFGDSGYIHGADPDAIRHLVNKGVLRDSILTPRKFLKWWDKYQDFGARLENVNRAANFIQDTKSGDKTLLEANFNARDHLDFSRTGSWVAVRALAQVVPFLNARLQGLDKLGRAAIDKNQRAQFTAVVGVYTLISVALYLAMKDDDDYKEAEEWERDTYHLFKLPGSEIMWRIPRPFEVGAIASTVERMAEQMVNDDVHGQLFAERLWFTATQTFAFNPIPQVAKPILEVYANKNTFTGRNIESIGMRLANLPAEDRKRAWTSATAIETSGLMNKISWGKVVLSPVQIEHLVRAYLGWTGAVVLEASDFVTRELEDSPEPPAIHWTGYPLIKRFAREAKGRNSKYITDFYDHVNELNEIQAAMKQAREWGNTEKAMDILKENKDKLKWRRRYNALRRRLSKLRKKAEKIYLSKKLDPKLKKLKLDRARQEQKRLAKIIEERAKDVF